MSVTCQLHTSVARGGLNKRGLAGGNVAALLCLGDHREADAILDLPHASYMSCHRQFEGLGYRGAKKANDYSNKIKKKIQMIYRNPFLSLPLTMFPTISSLLNPRVGVGCVT